MKPIPQWITVELLNKMRDEGETHPSRVQYIESVKRFYKWYRGSTLLVPVEEYDDMEIDERQAPARRNIIGETVDETVSIFLKNNPIVRRWPYHPQDADLSDDMDAMWLSAWGDSKGPSNIQTMLHEAAVTGFSVAKVIWNPINISKDKSGEIMIHRLSPGAVIVDPFADHTQRGSDVRYIIHCSKQPADEIIRRYGTEGEVALGLRSPQGRSKKAKWPFSASEILKSLRGTGRDVDEKVQSRFDVYEFWLFPKTMYVSEMVLGEKIEIGEYPYGIVVTMINDKIVRWMKNPFVESKKTQVMTEMGYPIEQMTEIGHKRHPFVFMWWKRVTDEEGNSGIYDCMGMVEPMMSMQFNINALRRNIAINSRTIANPPTVINEDAIDGPAENLTYMPGEIIRVHDVQIAEQAIKQLQPAQMPQYVFEMLGSDIVGIKEAAGIKPGVVGLFPPPAGGTSHTPAGTIGTLQESAFGPLWRYVKELADALLDISILYDGLIQQKYKPGRYSHTSQYGVEKFVEWTSRHITANFRREVVAGATTPLYDVEKDMRSSTALQATLGALQSQNPAVMKATVIHLQNLDYPWAYAFIQLLQEEVNMLLQMQQGLQGLGSLELGNRLQQPSEEPTQGQPELDYSGLTEFAQEAGTTPETVLMNIEEQME